MTTPAQALQNAGWTLTANHLGNVIVGSRRLRARTALVSFRWFGTFFEAEIRLPTTLLGTGADVDPAEALRKATEAARDFLTDGMEILA